MLPFLCVFLGTLYPDCTKKEKSKSTAERSAPFAKVCFSTLCVTRTSGRSALQQHILDRVGMLLAPTTLRAVVSANAARWTRASDEALVLCKQAYRCADTTMSRDACFISIMSVCPEITCNALARVYSPLMTMQKDTAGKTGFHP